MMFQVPAVDYEPAEEFVKALNVLFILHADHEQNCSTSTGRLVGSSQANLFASNFFRHCRALGAITRRSKTGSFGNAVRIQMTVEISINMWNGKGKDSGFRLMGFGHRVYKNFDPRALIIKNYCDQILEKVGLHDPLLDIAKQLEQVALKMIFSKNENFIPMLISTVESSKSPGFSN
ncbi:MAG: hypothetical protein Ct9H90mP8_2780 [Pseudomonadota bacterium]|nr:MAG: hypothetical protein Ct9H90mP8_2780 [Pseudomonadota bacterium]